MFFLVISIIAIVFIVDKIKYARINSWITDVKDLVRDPNSFHYVNDLYISDGRHYEHMLNDKEKGDYEKLFTAIKNRETEIELDLKDDEYVNEVMPKIEGAIKMDHPELLYFSACAFRRIGDKVMAKITYPMNESEYEKNITTMMGILEEIKKDIEIL